MQSCYKPWYTNDESVYNTNTISSIYYIRQKKVTTPTNSTLKNTLQTLTRQHWKRLHDRIKNVFLLYKAKKSFNNKKLSTEKNRLWITFFCDTKKSNALVTTFLWKRKNKIAMKTFTFHYFHFLFPRQNQFMKTCTYRLYGTFFQKNK